MGEYPQNIPAMMLRVFLYEFIVEDTWITYLSLKENSKYLK